MWVYNFFGFEAKGGRWMLSVLYPVVCIFETLMSNKKKSTSWVAVLASHLGT